MSEVVHDALFHGVELVQLFIEQLLELQLQLFELGLAASGVEKFANLGGSRR